MQCTTTETGSDVGNEQEPTAPNQENRTETDPDPKDTIIEALQINRRTRANDRGKNEAGYFVRVQSATNNTNRKKGMTVRKTMAHY